MLQAIMNQSLLLYGVVLFSVLGVVSQITLNAIYAKVIKDMENMSLPKSKFLKQLKQKYQNFRQMNGNKIENVNVFLQKQLMEYKVLKMSLHTWRRLGGAAFIIGAVIGLGGYYLSSTIEAAAQTQLNYLWAVGASAILTLAIYGLTDVGYKRKYLITGLENHFTNTRIGQAPHQEAPATPVPEAVEQKTEKFSMRSRRKREKITQTKAQRDKQELKENLAKLKEGISETAAEVERNKERNTEILKQMDPMEQERVIREVLKEFLS